MRGTPGYDSSRPGTPPSPAPGALVPSSHFLGERPRAGHRGERPAVAVCGLTGPRGAPGLRSRRAGARSPGRAAMAVKPGTRAPGRRARGPRGGRTGPTAERAPSPSSASRRRLGQRAPPTPRRDPGAGSAPAPKPAQTGTAPSATPFATWLFPFPGGGEAGARRVWGQPAPGSRAGETRLPPRGRVVRAGGGPSAALCLGLPGLVQSRAAALRERADPGGSGDFAGALQPSPPEEGSGRPRGRLAPSHGERR